MTEGGTLKLGRLAGLMHEGEQGRTALPWLDDLDGAEERTPFLFQLDQDGNGGPYGLIAAGNLHIIKGAKKEGKSAAGIALLVAALSGRFIKVSSARARLRLLWIDTEQDLQTLRQRARATLQMAGSKTRPDTLRILPLRGYSESERARMVSQAIEEAAPDLVLLDGVVDLCREFNDEKASRAVANELAAICERTGAAILAVIHTNPREDKARGHLGTIVEQKSGEIYLVKKSGDVATVTQEASRFAPVPSWSFEFTNDFMIKGPGSAASLARRVQDLRDVFGRIFEGRGARRHKDLVADYRTELDCKETTAKKAISDALRFNVLSKEGAGSDTRYHFKPLDEIFDSVSE